jgi:hypothetical protein
MKKTPPDVTQIHELIRGLSPNHILKNSPQNYIDDFVVAALEVYDPAKLRKILQAKFFMPDESNYSDQAYYQNASELSVARYIKIAGGTHLAVETEALSQRIIVEILRNRLDQLLPEPLTRVLERESRERTALRNILH